MDSENMEDYSGPFDPDFSYEKLSKEALVKLLREWGLYVQLLDRAMCAAAYLKYGPEAMEHLAIEEWRGASPVFTQRVRKALNIDGDGIPDIFKALQLDPGFVHQYMDVHYEIVDDSRGFFELHYCGALEDTEPAGEESVVRMCHHIEDATFPATIQAVNPKAKIRPVHRPPRKDANQKPVCRWEVWIDDETEPNEDAHITKLTRKSSAATFRFEHSDNKSNGQ